MIKDIVTDYLDNLGIKYSLFSHPKAFSIDDCKGLKDLVGGRICKNLYLRTSNGKTKVLLIIDADKQLITKNVSKAIGVSRLSFCSAGEMVDDLNTNPGSLGLMSLIFDNSHDILLAIDTDVLKEEYFLCHPCDNTATLKIRTEDVINRIIPSLGNKSVSIEI